MNTKTSQKNNLLTFLRCHHVAAIATVKKGNYAHASTIYYYSDMNFTFYFATKNKTLKFRNIADNKSVGLVISDEKNMQTVQVEGNAYNITDENDLAQAIKNVAVVSLGRDKNIDEIPISQIQHGQLLLFKIIPTWICYTSYKHWGQVILYEHRFTTSADGE